MSDIDTTESPFFGMLKGVAQIASYIDETERRTHYMLDQGDLPAFKWRGRWRARPSTLDECLRHLEAAHRGP